MVIFTGDYCFVRILLADARTDVRSVNNAIILFRCEGEGIAGHNEEKEESGGFRNPSHGHSDVQMIPVARGKKVAARSWLGSARFVG